MNLAVFAIRLVLRAALQRIRNPQAFRHAVTQAREANRTTRTLYTQHRDMYDQLPPERGALLRRRNKERLAHLEANGPARRQRLQHVKDNQ